MANGTGGISAEVINIQNNQPLSDASVKLGGPVTQEQTTGSDGQVTFSNLPPADNYTLDISASGYNAEHYEDIVVIDNNVTNLAKLALWPAD